MNKLTDAEISRRLALAIGWNDEEMRLTYEFGFQVAAKPLRSSFHSGPWWRCFDYRDPDVIWPIAERFAAFPMKSAKGTGWVAITEDLWNSDSNYDFANADTAAKAVALAVIKSKEVK